MPNTNEGKCLSCGLLSKRTAPDFSGLNYYEVRPEDRKSGNLFSFPGPSRPLLRCSPCCYAGAAPLAQEVMDEVPESSADDKWSQQQDKWQRDCISVLSKDRKCLSWVEYVEGLPPQWHLEVYQMSLLQKAREEWEIRMEKDRREWQNEFQNQMENSRREWHERFQKQSSKLNNGLAWAAAIFGFLQVVAALIGLIPWFVSLYYATGSNVKFP